MSILKLDYSKWDHNPLIVIEGSDGLGKSTLAETLHNAIYQDTKGKIKSLREPTGAIREILKSGTRWEPATIDLLMTASHVQLLAHMSEYAIPNIFLLDRWTPISSYAYMLGMRERPVDDYIALSHFFTKTPDMILWLDASYEVSRSRRPMHDNPAGLLEKWDNAGEDAYEKTRRQYDRILSATRSKIYKLDASVDRTRLFLDACNLTIKFLMDFGN